jgi:hypothetical protein
MTGRIRGISAVAVLVALAIGGCGSSGGGSSDATGLLQQTFSSGHRVDSGNLNFSLTVDPSGSSTIKGPIKITFGGPFQSLGQSKLPASNFTIGFSAFGKSGSLALLSTGSNGYVMVSGATYQLPAATFQRIESGFSGITSSGGSGSGPLGKLGIDPRHWLTNPSLAGHETIDGADTTHIAAGIDIVKLLVDVNKLLSNAGQLGVKSTTAIPTISPASQAKVAAAIKNPKVDVWTGSSDKLLRRLTVALTVPVTGQVSTLLGGLSSAAISLTLGYSAVNQHQTIPTPTATRPYSEFQQKIQALVQSLRGTAAGAAAGSSGAAVPSAGAATSSITAYAQCIQAAGGDVAKMQGCAGLLQKKK